MAMFGTKKHPRLVVTAGNQLGKTYPLKKGEYSVGSHKKCRVRITGEYVSDLHALIEKNADGVWVLTNNSPNGTYVNQRQVDSTELDDVSVIQIGADNSFEFIPANYKEHSNNEANSAEAKASRQKIGKWPLIIGGLVLFYVPLFVYLKQLGEDIGSSKEQQILSLTAIERVSTESTDYLAGVSVNDDRQANMKMRTQADINRDAYENLLLGSYMDDVEKNALIEQLVEKSKSHLTTAHLYIQMDMKKKAESSLRSAMSVVPDHRNPITGFAAQTISKLNEPEKLD